MNEETKMVYVPAVWLERLLEIKREIDTYDLLAVNVLPFAQLMGYIESAETLLEANAAVSDEGTEESSAIN